MTLGYEKGQGMGWASSKSVQAIDKSSVHLNCPIDSDPLHNILHDQDMDTTQKGDFFFFFCTLANHWSLGIFKWILNLQMVVNNLK